MTAGGREDERTGPTAADVAALAGVSRATVSYVLNGLVDERIGPETWAEVRAVARELGYVPPGGRRTTGHELVIGHLGGERMTLARLATAGLDRLAVELGEAGYTMVLHRDTELKGMAAARSWAALRPAAVIAHADRFTKGGAELLRRAGVVPIGIATQPVPAVPTLVIDDSRLGEVAAEHLAERGCRRVLVVVPKAKGDRQLVAHRVAGFERVAARTGMRLEVVRMGLRRDSADRLIRTVAGDDPPDGVFACTDDHAGLLLGALLDRGVRVPGDLALVGADNAPFCEMLRPRLTSAEIDLDAPGADLGRAVLAAIRGRWDPDAAARPWPAVLHVRDT
ncbi:LacI family DNA-binding transcriptional regulator [Saccharopolyspora cebuensis]|uniref:LacI family DNA-binding transcriptional regulator n=1 Tax=Saccharopolyspora cebuensis TaxID=418759 RepID=A0ABV4CFV2_9PSEU